MAVMGYIDQWDINGEQYDIHDKDRALPNGVATLDSNGRIPYSQLPESAIELKGYWDASTNTPALVDGTGTNGDEYIVSVAGTQDLGSGAQYFGVGDRILYTSGVWKNIASGFVRTVNNQSPDAQGNSELVFGTSIPFSKEMILQEYAYDMLQSPPIVLDGTLNYRIKKIQNFWYSFDTVPGSSPSISLRSSTIEPVSNFVQMYDSDSNAIRAVAIAGDENNNLVAVGSYHSSPFSFNIYYSHDNGEHWTKAYSIPVTASNLNGYSHEFDSMLAYGNGVWVVNLGSVYTVSSSLHKGFFVSTDNGESWELIELASGALTGVDIKLTKYCPYGNFFMLATNSDSMVQLKADPNDLAVTRISTTTALAWHSMVFTEHIIWGLGNTSAYSIDKGVTWNTMSIGTPYSGWIAKDSTLYLPNGRIIWYTSDSSLTPSSPISIDASMVKIGNCFIGVGKSDSLYNRFEVTKDFVTKLTRGSNTSLFYFKNASSNVRWSFDKISQVFEYNGAIYMLARILDPEDISNNRRGIFKFTLEGLKTTGKLPENAIL